MQIESIVLYHRDGRRHHEVDFNLGELNIVTGVSETGKSALIEIVDYVLGSDRHGVFKSEELATIGWYGLRLRIREHAVFVARRAPDPGNKTSDHAMLSFGGEAAPPPGAMTQTTNAANATARLGELIGIEEAEGHVPEGSTRQPVKATLRHALAYAFQRQRLIADPEYLFSGQDRPFAATAIRDTLPYFLGAVDTDALQQRRELRARRGELARSKATLRQLSETSTELIRRERSILAQAISTGLASNEQAEIAGSEIRPLLSALADPDHEIGEIRLGADAERLAALDQRRRDATNDLREARAQRRQLTDRRKLAADFAHESQEHSARLLSLDLVAETEKSGPACPLCGLSGGEQDPASDVVRAELQRARKQAATSAASEPRLDGAIQELDEVIARLRGALTQVETELQAALAQDEAARRARTLRERQAYVRGRIAAFLEEHPVLDRAAEADARAEVESLTAVVDTLERALSAEMTRVRTERTLESVGVEMTRMALDLELGYTAGGVRLDPVALTVVTGDPDDPTYLNEDIGSGKNWVGYHLVSLLALHEHFVRRGRPVPRFLMLDQPTQAFYPSERRRAADRSVNELHDEDQAMVRRQFELLRDTVEALDGGLQVIVTDHADIAEDWFGVATRHDWRDGRALVPTDWYA
jgi:hypothetical protein